jgi:hypothetical protein
VRLWFSPKLDFGADQRAIYELGKTFYETGVVPAEGPRLVYTGEAIPGGFQAIMAGIPLFIFNGEPVGLQIWVGVLNWAAMLLLFLWLRTKVQPRFETLLAVFVAFSPWSLLFSPAWNPSFLPIFAVPFFWVLEKVLDSRSHEKKIEAYALGLIVVLCFQLHLSAVLFLLALMVAFPFIKRKVQFIIFTIAGFLTGGSLLIPWILKRVAGETSAPMGVVGLHLENVLDIPKAFLRYITFSTAEISRFITPQGHGFMGMLGMLKDEPLVWLPALVSFAGSLVLIYLFLKRWIGLRKSLTHGFTCLEFLLPILMTFTFLFSIKSSSAHTFWILMPLSYYSMVSALGDMKGKKFRNRAWIYLIASLLFTFLGFKALLGDPLLSM